MQAYAEIEADTPGSVFGVTQKSDGKWGKTSNNSKKTQGAEHDSRGQDSHDNTDEENRAEVSENQRLYKFAGGVIVLLIVLYLTRKQPDSSDHWMVNQWAHERGLQSDGENRDRFKDA